MPSTIRVEASRSTGCSSSLRRIASAASTARKLKELMTKQTPVPATAITTPAIAGPITRAPLKRPALSAIAFGSERGPTIWYVSD